MYTMLNIVYISWFIFSIYDIVLMTKLKSSCMRNMRILALIWATFISFSYLILNNVWENWKIVKTVIVPINLDKSFNYWELSVWLIIIFMLIINYIWVKKWFYKNNI